MAMSFSHSAGVLAQERRAETAPSNDGLASALDEEILVTARKQEETILEVPLAITAFTDKSLQQRQIRDLADVALLTPGLAFEAYSGGGTATPVIRGATQQSTTVLEQNVSLFLDGVYLPRQYVADIGTDNLERLEIVKGPQGALYGQNSFMGAINYITKSPSRDFSGSFRTTIGSDELREASGTVSVPIARDVLSVRLDGAYSTFDGTWKNNHPLANADIPGPNTDGNFGGWDKWNVGAKLLFTPMENLRIDASYRHFDIEHEGTARVNFTGANALSSPDSVTSARNNCGVVGALGPGLFCGRLPAVDPDRFALDPRQFGAHSESDFFAANAELDITDGLQLKYGFGHIETSVLQISSQADRNSLTPNSTMTFSGIPIGGLDYTQHELRARYEVTDTLEISLGGFSSRNEDTYNFLLGPGIPTLSTRPVVVSDLRITASDTITDVKTEAIFGAARFKFLDERLRLGFEGRYTWEEKDVLSVSAKVARGFKSSFFNPRITLDYDLHERTLIYASAANGTKAGGVNPDPAIYAPFGGLIASERTFGPDRNWTYEVGTKTRLFDNRAQFELNAFYVDLSSLQINTLSTTPPGFVLPRGIDRAPTILLNLGGATIKGLEFQGQFQATSNLSLLFGGSYQRAEYKEGVLGTRTLSICDGRACGQFIGGNVLQRAPATKAFGGFVFQQPLVITNRDAMFTLQGDVAYQGKQYVDETNTSTIGSRTLVNMSASLASGPLSLRIWAKNLTNLNYVSSAIFGPFTTSFYTPIAGQRRTFGLTLGADF